MLEALKLLAEHNIGALIVLNDDASIAGILSERDYARKVALEGRVSNETRVSEIMTSDVISVSVDEKVEACMALMTGKHIRHLPVMDGEKLVGIISIGDVVKAIMSEQQQTIESLEQYIHHAS